MREFKLLWWALLIMFVLFCFFSSIEQDKMIAQLQQNQADDHYQMIRNCWSVAKIENNLSNWRKEFYLKKRED